MEQTVQKKPRKKRDYEAENIKRQAKREALKNKVIPLPKEVSNPGFERMRDPNYIALENALCKADKSGLSAIKGLLLFAIEFRINQANNGSLPMILNESGKEVSAADYCKILSTIKKSLQ